MPAATRRHGVRHCLGRFLVAFAAPAFLGAVLFLVIPRVLVTVAPGPAPDVATLVLPSRNGPGGDDPGAEPGRFLVTTVLASSATPAELWKAVLDPAVDILRRASLVPPGMTDEAYEAWGRASMVESQFLAAREALAYLGQDVRLEAEGARVFFVSRVSPARGLLEPGDVVVSWQVGLAREDAGLAEAFETGVRQAILEHGEGAGPGSPGGKIDLSLAIERSGKISLVHVPVSRPDLALWPFLGVALGAEGLRSVPELPVIFPPGAIAGPSGGLILSLGIIDLLTPGDLAGGRTVAGTGTVSEGGYVGAVGGIDKKMRGAVASGATLFLIPEDDYPGAAALSSSLGFDDLELMPVSTVAGACRALASLTGRKAPDYNGADLPPPPVRELAWAAVATR